MIDAVVDAHEHGKHVGTDREHILLPTGKKRSRLAAAHRAVDKFKMPLRIHKSEQSRYDIGVAMPDLMVFIPFGRAAFIPVAVRNRVSLEKDLHNFHFFRPLLWSILYNIWQPKSTEEKNIAVSGNLNGD